MTTLIPVFAYCRCSTTRQLSGDGPERQQAAIAQFAQANGYEVAETFFDDVTGTTDDLAKREAYARMLNAIAANGVKVIVVERADRLARSLVVQENLLDGLLKMGVQAFDAYGTDLSVLDGNPERVMIRQILGAVAECKKRLDVLRLKVARERLKERSTVRDANGNVLVKGRCGGNPPFGERAGETEIISRMIALRKAGASLAGIADALNRDGVPSRRGGWWRQQVGIVLQRAINAVSCVSQKDSKNL